MKRKPVVAWAAVEDGSVLWSFGSRNAADRWAAAHPHIQVSIVKLVEHDPTAAAVLRAAVRERRLWAAHKRDDSTGADTDRWRTAAADVARAVALYRGRKR